MADGLLLRNRIRKIYDTKIHIRPFGRSDRIIIPMACATCGSNTSEN